MISFDVLHKNTEHIKQGLKAKKSAVDVDALIRLDNEYREILTQVEKLRAERNDLSDSIATADQATRQPLLEKAEHLKQTTSSLEEKLKITKQQRDDIARLVPNPPFDEVPRGDNENDNVVLRKVGNPTTAHKQNYLEFALEHDLIDIERAAKVSGTRFGYLKRELVLLEFALVNFVFDELMHKEFVPISPPVLIGEQAMRGLGYLDKDPDEIYHIEKDNLYLVGTAEHSIVPMFSGEALDVESLPFRYIGFSTAFRREAGSYGKDTKGILRVHQFDKLEMVSFAHPENSKDEHLLMLEIQESLMKKLEIPYQVVHICTGDMGFSAANQYDVESYIPSEGKYRETHSTSNTTDFQARRLNIRYAGKQEKGFVHILNGTAFAIGRILIALLENHQQTDGAFVVPEALRSYTSFDYIKHQ